MGSCVLSGHRTGGASSNECITSHRAAQAGFRDAPEYCEHAESHVQSDSSREVGRGTISNNGSARMTVPCEWWSLVGRVADV